MPLIPYKPFGDLEKWLEKELSDWDSFWSERWKRFFKEELDIPKVDLYEKNGKIVAEIAVPGMKAEDINVELEDRYLKVTGKKEEKKEEKERGYYRKEISSGFFKRIIPLPEEVNKDSVEASLEDGILKIVMDKKTKEKPSTVKVKIQEKKSQKK